MILKMTTEDERKGFQHQLPSFAQILQQKGVVKNRVQMLQERSETVKIGLLEQARWRREVHRTGRKRYASGSPWRLDKRMTNTLQKLKKANLKGTRIVLFSATRRRCPCVAIITDITDSTARSIGRVTSEWHFCGEHRKRVQFSNRRGVLLNIISGGFLFSSIFAHHHHHFSKKKCTIKK